MSEELINETAIYIEMVQRILELIKGNGSEISVSASRIFGKKTTHITDTN